VTEQVVDNQAGRPGLDVDQLLDVVRKVLDKPDLRADDDVMDHGGTSLSVVRILAEVRNTLGLSVNPRDLNGVVSARSLAAAAH
jgi:acyl carrier protein